MPEAPLELTQRRAEELREAVRQLHVSYRGRLIGPITISAGVAEEPVEVELRGPIQPKMLARKETWIIAEDAPSSPMFFTKERSILILSKGKRCK